LDLIQPIEPPPPPPIASARIRHMRAGVSRQPGEVATRAASTHDAAMSASPLAGALRGIRVLDLSRLLPGPFLTMVLADMGADVIKVEDPRVGDYLRAFPPAKGGLSGRYLAVNRGKRSLALDLKAPAQRDAFLKMVERADVVVESFRPGVMDKLGVGYSALAAKNPKVILCSISGYGQ